MSLRTTNRTRVHGTGELSPLSFVMFYAFSKGLPQNEVGSFLLLLRIMFMPVICYLPSTYDNQQLQVNLLG